MAVNAENLNSDHPLLGIVILMSQTLRRKKQNEPWQKGDFQGNALDIFLSNSEMD